MVRAESQKIVWITEPQAIFDNTAIPTASIDTKGWRHCKVVCRVGATDIAMTTLKMQESDSDGSYADITGLVASGTTGSGRLPQDTDDNKTFTFSIDMKGRKRFLNLDATAGNGTAGTFFTAFALLSNPEEHPNTAAERGAEWELTSPS